MLFFNYKLASLLNFLGFHVGVSNYLYLKNINKQELGLAKKIIYHLFKIVNIILIYMAIFLLSINQSENLVLAYGLNALGFTLGSGALLIIDLKFRYEHIYLSKN